MILGLIGFQAAIGLLLILAEPFMAAGHGSLRLWLATEQVSQLLGESLRRDETGDLVVAPSPAMQDYMVATPGFWFLATDGANHVRGGNVPEFPPHRRSDKLHDRLDLPRGTTIQLRNEGRRVAVLLSGQQGAIVDGVMAWLTDRLRRWLLALAIVSVCTTAITVALVQLLLRPVRHAAQAAAALAPGQPGPALPVEGVPAEILPLVSATNAAFGRLEAEHECQRRFLANAAHELRTPIAILGLRLDELPEGPLRQRLRQDARRLATLAEQMLDLERLNAGVAAHRPVEMVALAREVVGEIGPLAIDTGGEIAFRSALPRLEVMGDEQALRSVLMNLLGNALAHGGPSVMVELRIEADGSLEVADQGAGVPADARERVFEAFQRAGGGHGAGLGLYIVREVLRAHGASIELRDGKPGAVFRLRFGPHHA
jgi:signal transduction histidine kinase